LATFATAMAKRTLVPWEWDGVDVDPSAPVGKKGDKVSN
jgi:hypothetical protein